MQYSNKGFSTGVGLVFLQAVKCKIQKENTEFLGIICANLFMLKNFVRESMLSRNFRQFLSVSFHLSTYPSLHLSDLYIFHR